MEYKYVANLDNSSMHYKDQKLLSHSLATVSTCEIRSFISRVNFYLEHFSIINRRQKQKCKSVENKITFLKKVSRHLKEEVIKRNILVTMS